MDRVLQAIAMDPRIGRFRVKEFSDRIEIAQPFYSCIMVLRKAGSYRAEVRFGRVTRKTAVLLTFAMHVFLIAITPAIAFFMGAGWAILFLVLGALSFSYDRHRVNSTEKTEAIVREIMERLPEAAERSANFPGGAPGNAL